MSAAVYLLSLLGVAVPLSVCLWLALRQLGEAQDQIVRMSVYQSDRTAGEQVAVLRAADPAVRPPDPAVEKALQAASARFPIGL